LTGIHSLKLGGEFRQFLNNNFRLGTGAFTFATLADFLARTTWSDVLGNGVATLATSLFSNALPPADLKSLVPKISGAVLFVYGENGQPAEEPA